MIIFNDKTLADNVQHPYNYLKKYIIEFNIEKFNIEKYFKFYNYLYIKDLNKIDSLDSYLKEYNYINFYLIYNLFRIIN